MKTISSSNILKEMESLKIGEKLFIKLDKDINNIIKLLDIQSRSYENLFMSYLNKTTEEANEMNLDKFLNAYTKIFMQKNEIIETLLKNLLRDGYDYFKLNNIRYSINYELNLLSIFKLGGCSNA